MEDCEDTPINDIRNARTVKDEMIDEVIDHYYPDNKPRIFDERKTYRTHLYELSPEGFKSFMMGFYIRRLEDVPAERGDIFKKIKSL